MNDKPSLALDISCQFDGNHSRWLIAKKNKKKKKEHISLSDLRENEV